MTEFHGLEADGDKLLDSDVEQRIIFNSYIYSRDNLVERRREQWQEMYEAYRNNIEIYDDGSKTDISIPMIFADVEAYLPRLVQNKPKIDVWPWVAADREKAEKGRAYIDHIWDQLEMPMKLIDYAKSGLMYGTAIWKVSHKRRIEKRMITRMRPEAREFMGLPLGNVDVESTKPEDVVTWDGPDVELMDLDDIYPDPDGWDIDSCDYIIERRVTSIDEMEASLAADEGVYIKSAVAELKERVKAGNYKMTDLHGEELKTKRKEDMGDVTEYEDPYKREIHELIYYTDAKIVSIIQEDLSLPPVQKRYHSEGSKPFIRFTPIPMPKEFYGLSLIEILFGLNVELNVLHGARMDNLLYAAHKMFKVLRTSGINPYEMDFVPGGAVVVDHMNDIEEMRTQPLDFSLYRETQELEKWDQRAGGATNTFVGMDAGGGGTATEAANMMKSSGSRVGLMFQIMSEQALVPLAKKWLRIAELYITEPVHVRMPPDPAAMGLQGPDMAGGVPGRGNPLEALMGGQVDQSGPGVQGPMAGLMGSMGGAPQPDPTEDQFDTIFPETFASKSGKDLGVKISVNATEPETKQFKVQESMMALQTFGGMGLPLQHPMMEEMMVNLADAFGVENPKAKIAQGRAIIEQQQAFQAQVAGGGGQASPPRSRQLQKPVGGPGAATGP
jgi:hypothetical protein